MLWPTVTGGNLAKIHVNDKWLDGDNLTEYPDCNFLPLWCRSTQFAGSRYAPRDTKTHEKINTSINLPPCYNVLHHWTRFVTNRASGSQFAVANNSGVKLLMIRLDSHDSSPMVPCKVKSPERKSTRGVSNSRVVRLLTIRLDSNDSRES